MKYICTEQHIISAWYLHHSVNRIAKDYNISWNRVVKTLSSNGIVCNETHRLILDLYNKGFDAKLIAKLLPISEKTVEAYLPRSRPVYGENLSRNAINIRKCRNK